MRRQLYRRAWLAVGFVALAFLFVFSYSLWRVETLAARFSQMHPDESEAQLLEFVGRPSAMRRCDEGPRPVQANGGRTCARVYWYGAPFRQDGWLVPIDDAGTIMQIDRRALP